MHTAKGNYIDIIKTHKRNSHTLERRLFRGKVLKHSIIYTISFTSLNYSTDQLLPRVAFRVRHVKVTRIFKPVMTN